MTQGNPYWQRAIQSQARAQSKPSGKPQQQQSKQQDFGGFDSLIVGKECVIKLGCGEAVKGVVSAASKFWYLVTVDGQVLLINKAWVVSVAPTQNTNKNNANNGAAGVNGGEGGAPRPR
jgi:sRNA-binding regulator protein Hfq